PGSGVAILASRCRTGARPGGWPRVPSRHAAPRHGPPSGEPGGTARPRRARVQREGPRTVRLEDKVTIITGAGGGMGRTAARMFAAEGARVVCVDVTEEMAESAAADVTAAGGQATAVAADVSRDDQAKRMVDHAVATF